MYLLAIAVYVLHISYIKSHNPLENMYLTTVHDCYIIIVHQQKGVTMYSTSEQAYTAASNLTDNIGGFFSELLRLLFALIDTLINCAMYVFDCVTSNPILLLAFVVCLMYYVRRKYYVHSVKPKRVRKQ